MTVVGFDIGGANLKMATSDASHCCEVPFPLWKNASMLADELGRMVGKVEAASQFAVTMTGELADCFSTKGEGVRAIIAAVLKVARDRPVAIWSTQGDFVTPEEACVEPMSVASANWHALATCWAREHPTQSGLLIDIGSTTTDVIPFAGGRCTAHGKTDLARLMAGELLYRGVHRTPVCAIQRSVGLRGASVPLAAELFATSLDLFLIRGDLDEDISDRNTANGQPATVGAAIDRLARQLCCDRIELSESEVREIADELIASLVNEIGNSIQRVAREPQLILLAGAGSFLAKESLRTSSALAEVKTADLAAMWGPVQSQAACAFAVARMKAGLNSF